MTQKKIRAEDDVTITVLRTPLRLVCLSVECAEGCSETWLTPSNARKLAAELLREAYRIRPAQTRKEPRP